jgi:hypothetical protein
MREQTSVYSHTRSGSGSFAPSVTSANHDNIKRQIIFHTANL